MRRAARLDTDHLSHVSALLAIGASVQSLAGVGAGCPDLVVGYHGANVLIEVKQPIPPGADPESRHSREHGISLDDLQVKFHKLWKGQIAVSRSPEESVVIVQSVARSAITKSSPKDPHAGSSTRRMGT